ncbi:hypothetical protein C2E23DRAFT_721443 [Lenzites betulinus]|nr:hypothetical protein C2E23DRAFT_721443 [Lenzites betulinus]
MPLIWRKYLPEATKDFTTAKKKYDTALKKHEESVAKYEHTLETLRAQADAADDEKNALQLDKKIKALTAKPPVAPEMPVPRMQAGEIPLMLKLATSLRLLLGSQTTVAQRKRGADLLYSYLTAYKELYGVQAMVPNHHFATHVPPQLEDYATVYDMWAFLPERLNKVLKGTNLNNRRGGQQEVTMMREFNRETELRTMITCLRNKPEDSGVDGSTATHEIVSRLLHNSREARGTFEAMADSVADDAAFSGNANIGIGVASTDAVNLDLPVRDAILEHYASVARQDIRPPMPTIYHGHDPRAPIGSFFLATAAHTLSYIVKSGRRITAVSSSGIVKVKTATGEYHAGQIARFVLHVQPGRPTHQIFAEMQWMVPQKITDPPEDVWAD